MLKIDIRRFKCQSFTDAQARINQVLDYAVECGLIPTNPAKSAKKPKTVKSLQDVAGDIEEKYCFLTTILLSASFCSLRNSFSASLLVANPPRWKTKIISPIH